MRALHARPSRQYHASPASAGDTMQLPATWLCTASQAARPSTQPKEGIASDRQQPQVEVVLHWCAQIRSRICMSDGEHHYLQGPCVPLLFPCNASWYPAAACSAHCAGHQRPHWWTWQRGCGTKMGVVPKWGNNRCLGGCHLPALHQLHTRQYKQLTVNVPLALRLKSTTASPSLCVHRWEGIS